MSGLLKSVLVSAIAFGTACGHSDDKSSGNAVAGGMTGVAGSSGNSPFAGGTSSIGTLTNHATSGGSSAGMPSADASGAGAAVGGAAVGGATILTPPTGGSQGTSTAVASSLAGGSANTGGGLTIATGGVSTRVTTSTLGGSANPTSGGTASGGASVTRASGGTSIAGGAACAPRGGVSNNQTYGDTLAPIPFTCASDTDCTDGICFDGPAAQTWSCRSPCKLEGVGTEGDCSAGQICTFLSTTKKAACLDACKPFQATSVCHDGDWCYPMPHASFTSGVAVPGLCLAAGEYTDGERCPGGGCGQGLLCVSPALIVFDNYHCEPACDPAAVAGQPGACATGESCVTEVEGRGHCSRRCDPFSQSTQCPTGEWCYPFHTQNGSTRGVEGRCVKTGKHPRGAVCSIGECDAGLKCARPPSSSTEGVATCQPVCDPSATAPCPQGEVCIADRASGEPLKVGTCQKSCQLFEPDPCNAGCASNEWCAPSSLEPNFGICTLAGTQTTGASCSGTKTCAAGDVCLCKTPGACNSLETVCRRTCVLSGSGTDVVHCQASEICVAERVQGNLTPFGICRGACDHDNGVPCAHAGETCVTGALMPQGKDACYELKGFSCTSRAYGGEPCGPTAVCTTELIVGQCTDICRVSVGAIGADHHPDCPDATSTCEELEPGLSYGECK